MNEEELLLEALSLSESFQELDIVKRYLICKKNISENKYLNEILDERIKLQKTIKDLKDEKKDECIKKCKELQIEYDNNPLVINYKELKNEIFELLKPITEQEF